MNQDELMEKILDFIETQDGEFCTEWYATQRDFAAEIMRLFAEHLGLELVVPEYVPSKNKRYAQMEIDRQKMWEELLPKLYEAFESKYTVYYENGIRREFYGED